MNILRTVFLTFLILLINKNAFAYLINHPISFTLSLDKESYYEGEKITFFITITNNDKDRTLPVLLPHTQNTGQKLFYLNAYDKANNTMLLRYTEDKMLHMMVHDTGNVQLRYLKPLEQVVVPLYLNDFENYFNYHTQNASHHSFGVPLFAGIYKINVTYHPKGIPLGDSIYTYYNDFDKNIPIEGKQLMPAQGQISPLIDLKIKRSADTIVSIERQNYYIKTNGYNYFYFNKYMDKINTGEGLVHISTLPADSCTIKNEYFYNQFNELYNEYIVRFDDGDIREYRRFTNWCPEYLYTERYDAFKKKTNHEFQLPDGRFYSVTYHQPSGNIQQESYCSEDGTLCNITTYIYNKKGEFVKKKIEKTQPCAVVIIDEKKRSVKRVVNLEGH